jgi:hypothetical protein
MKTLYPVVEALRFSQWCGGYGVVSIATGYGLDNRGIKFESQYGQEFSFLHIVQTGSGVHPASYPMGTGGSFPRGKAAGAGS